MHTEQNMNFLFPGIMPALSRRPGIIHSHANKSYNAQSITNAVSECRRSCDSRNIDSGREPEFVQLFGWSMYFFALEWGVHECGSVNGIVCLLSSTMRINSTQDYLEERFLSYRNGRPYFYEAVIEYVECNDAYLRRLAAWDFRLSLVLDQISLFSTRG